MSDCEKRSGKFFCPDKWQFFEAIGSLLPHGRAWQSWDWFYGASSADELPTVMQKYWAAFAEVLGIFTARACNFLDELFCATASEALDLWYRDYGFPDPCEHYDDLCEKVAARGASTCEYLTEVAARRGWVIECRDCVGAPHVSYRLGCGARYGDGSRYGCAAPVCEPDTLYIKILADKSPSYTAAPPLSLGCGARYGDGGRYGCAAALGKIECLFSRIVHAHIKIEYEIVGV